MKSSSRSSPRAGLRALLVLLVLWLGQRGVAEEEGSAGLPGPARGAARPGRRELERDCEGCHEDIAREWRASWHRQANAEPAFQRALRREPRAFCRGCHAPEADPRRDATGWAAESGVACVTCHVPVPGDDTRSRARVVSKAGGTRHPELRDAGLAGDAACQGCHEFAFPPDRARRRPEPMQSTLAEHARSPWAGTSCIDCHMQREGGHRSHRFPGGHDEGWLQGALRVEARRAGTGQGGPAVELTLVPLRVGHMLPTGDLFRRLLVRAAGPGAQAERALQRRFTLEQQVPGTWVKVAERDDRLTGPQVVRLELDGGGGEVGPIRWEVRYQRVAFPRTSGDPADDELDGEVVLAEGELR